MIRLGSVFDLEILFLAVLCGIAVLISFARAENRIARWTHERRCWWCGDRRHRAIGSSSEMREHMVRDHGADRDRFGGVVVGLSHELTHRRGHVVYADPFDAFDAMREIR